MRVPTIVQYSTQLNSMTTQSSELDKLNQQMSTGQKLLHSSDDPVLALNIKATQDYINQLNTYTNNTTLAQNRSKIVEDNVQQSLSIIDRVKVLIHSAQSDTTNATDRANIVKELQGLLSSLSSYANAKDSQGNYIFSGTSSNTTPFSQVNGVYTYLGSQTTASIDVSTTVNLTYTDSGQAVFGDIRQGNGFFTINQGTPANTGTAETSTGLIYSQSDYVQDTYTLSFVTNSDGKLAYQVVGAASGQVVPMPPATTPASAPEYQEGNTISFNGISMSITGQPIAGDRFVVQPSGTQNALETLRQLINVIGSPISNDVDKAAFHQELSQLSAGFEQVSSHLTDYLSDIGYRSSTIDSQVSANSALVLNQTKVLSQLSDVDATEVIPALNQHMLILQLTNQSYLQLRDLFSNILKQGF